MYVRHLLLCVTCVLARASRDSRRPGVPRRAACKCRPQKLPRSERTFGRDPFGRDPGHCAQPISVYHSRPVLVGGTSRFHQSGFELFVHRMRDCALFVTCQTCLPTSPCAAEGFVSPVHPHTAYVVLEIMQVAHRRKIREVDCSLDAVRMWLADLDQEEKRTV